MTDSSRALDLLAIAAHPDDAELLCGGTLLRAADQGRRTGILDLSGGESGSYGSPDVRATEAHEAAARLGLADRRSAGLPDSALENTPATRLVVAREIRHLRPRTVILHWPSGRHPDHRAASELGRDACFVAGLRNAPLEGEPFRPRKIVYAVAFQEPTVEPSFVVDITDQMERKMEAIAAFGSQFTDRTWAGDVFGGGERPLLDQIRIHCAHYGSWIRRPYGEPFYTRETLEVDDVTRLGVRSM